MVNHGEMSKFVGTTLQREKFPFKRAKIKPLLL